MVQAFMSGVQGAAGVITIPGFTHPVRDLFLEDVLEYTGFVVGRGGKWSKPRKASAAPTTTVGCCLLPHIIKCHGMQAGKAGQQTLSAQTDFFTQYLRQIWL